MLLAYLALWWAFETSAWCNENSRVRVQGGVKRGAFKRIYTRL